MAVLSSYTAPHFALPFRLRQTVDYVEQDTIDDVVNCVTTLLRTYIGSRAEAPDFGIFDPAFTLQPINKDALRDQIVASEPRAQAFIAASPDVFDDLVERIVIEIETGGGQ